MPILPANIESIRKIVTDQQAYKLRWPLKPKHVIALVDGTTAHAVVAAYEAINPDNKIRMERYIKTGPHALTKIANLVWKQAPKMAAMFFLAVALGSCAAEPDLRAQVREICGVPAKDLANVNDYATCVYTVLDVHAEAAGYQQPMGGDE